MMKQLPLLLTFFIGLISNNLLVAQEAPCGTTINEQISTPDFVAANRPFNRPSQALTGDEVPVQFHIIGTSTGALTIDSAVIFQELALANEAFADIDIEFVHCGQINYIYNNEYVTFTKTVDEVICDQEDVPNAINIYFALNVENTAEESICGYAYNFGIKNRVILDNGCADNGSTFTHELGHSFSLLHTHSTSNGVEHVDGSNCQSAGDLLCDTPADPRLNTTIVTENCIYIGSEVDPQGQDYNPDTNNFMSYSRKFCRIRFSDEQLWQMSTYYSSFGGFLVCEADPVSTNDIQAIASIVYPNPATDEVYINGLKSSAVIRVTDAQGKVYAHYSAPRQEEPLNIPVFQKLPAGVYFLSIQFNDNAVVNTHRIVKQ